VLGAGDGEDGLAEGLGGDGAGVDGDAADRLHALDDDDILAELYEKYKKHGRKMEPELKLLLMLIASATAFHTTNTVLKHVPGLDDVIKKNPKIVNSFAKNMVKDPEDPIPPEFRAQQQMRGPNTKEFLERMRQSSTPAFNRAARQMMNNSDTDVTSTSRRKKKKPGITIPM
jgi:hypothetical protein